jgi:oligoendopeptidase F
MGEPLAAEVVWRIEDLYSGAQDPELEGDRQWCLEEAKHFAEAYSSGVGRLTTQELLEAVKRLEYLQARSQKFSAYAHLLFAIQTQNSEASALRQAAAEFYSLLRRDTLFFNLEWIQLDETRVQEYLDSPDLAPYRHYLKSARRWGPHVLTQPEEQILAETEPIGASSWCALFDKVLGHQRFGDNGRTEAEVLSDLYSPVRAVRKKAAVDLTEGLKQVLHVLTHIFNTLLLDKAITDRLRRYPHWLRARNLANETEDQTVQALVQAVTSRYDMVQRYYSIKQRLLGYDIIFDFDRYAPVPGMPQHLFSWEEAKDIVLSAFDHFSPRMADSASLFFDHRWIHAPVLPGKRSGAFAHPTIPEVHPYVLLNFTGTHRDVMTLAHELGHGIHQYLARSQGFFNSQTPLTMAETASVFGEMLVFHHLLEQVQNPQERLVLLCSKVDEALATVFRQVTMNRFEDLAHNQRRERGELTPEQLSQLWMETQQAMFGDSVQLLDYYRIWWCYIPHLVHSPGYVYAYAFGELLVFALYQQYRKKGEEFVPLYLELLEAGGKGEPQELLKPFGINLSDPQFWHQGLAFLDDMLSEAETLASK